MRVFVCVAGLPAVIVDALKERHWPKFLAMLDGEEPIIHPCPGGQYELDAKMALPFLEALTKRLQPVPQRTDVGIVPMYVNYAGVGTNRFVEQFHPFALRRPLAIAYPEAWHDKERKHRLKLYLGEFFSSLTHTMTTLRAVRDHLSGNGGALNALLLPLRNFASGVFVAQLNNLSTELSNTTGYRAASGHLEAFQKAIREHHPPIAHAGRKAFKDARNLVFGSPGSDRHGFARGRSTGHNYGCFLGSRVRLGGPYDGLFHFDCVPEGGSHLILPSYPNCHGANEAPGKKTHVNIAPNDAIR